MFDYEHLLLTTKTQLLDLQHITYPFFFGTTLVYI